MIAFCAYRDFHVSILEPLLNFCIAKSMDCTWVTFPFGPGKEDFPETGTSPEMKQKLLNSKIAITEYHKNLRFDLSITADVIHDEIHYFGKTICIGHGTISKNIYFTNQAIARRESFHETLCVPGPAYVDSFKGQVYTEVIPTGFSKFHNWNFTPNPKAQSILFAPTYNPEIGSLPFFYDYLCQSNQLHILVRLHGATDIQWKQKFQDACNNYSHLEWVASDPLQDLFQRSSLIISDYSSVYVEYLQTSKPILLYTPAHLKTQSFYTKDSIEVSVRECCYEFSSLSELQELLTKQNNAKITKQLYWKALLFESDNQYILPKMHQAIENVISQTPEPRHTPLNIYCDFTPSKKWLQSLQEKSFYHKFQCFNTTNSLSYPILFLKNEVDMPHHWDKIYDIAKCYQKSQQPWASLHNNAAEKERYIFNYFPQLKNVIDAQTLLKFRTFDHFEGPFAATSNHGVIFQEQSNPLFNNSSYITWLGFYLR